MRDWRELIGNRRLSPEAVDELAQHLEDTYLATLARGGDESAAMKAVHDELASLNQDNASLDIRTPRIGLLERMRQFIQIDLRDAIRQLRRSPGFSLLAIVVLAVGLGVNTAIFSLINSLLFRALPVRAPDELVFLYHYSNGSYGSIPGPVYDELAANTTMFRQLAGVSSDSAWVTVDGRTEYLAGSAVTGNYFETLGVPAQLGRTFSAGDDRAVGAPGIVISNDLWLSTFYGDPGVIGRTMRLSPDQQPTEAPGRDYEIVGVLPAGFSGTGSSASWAAPSYYVPVRQRASDTVCVQADGKLSPPRPPFFAPVGRLADGVAFASAADYIAQSSDGWERQWMTHGTPGAGNRFELRRTRYARIPIDSVGNVVPERLATALIVISGLLLLIAGSNLIGIFMARGVATRTDTAIRLSLGAGRWRVARQHLTEGYLLAIAGSAAGFGVAAALVRLFIASLPPSRFGGAVSTASPSIAASVDARVMVFALVTCAIVGTVIGFGPARQASNVNVLPALQLGAVTSVRTRRGLRHWIVVPQIAVALVLLLVTGAVARTVMVSEMTDPGYAPKGLVSVEFQLRAPDRCLAKLDYTKYSRRRDELVQRIGNLLPSLTSIQSAAVSSFLPHETALGASVITQDEVASGRHVNVHLFKITPDYFATMKIPVVAGRNFSDADGKAGTDREPAAVIVSRRLAESLWPGKSAVGRLLVMHSPGATFPSRWSEVIGVADDILSPLHNGYPAPTLYTPVAPGGLVNRVVARAKGSSANAVRDITAIVRSADPSAVVIASGTVSEAIAQIRFSRRLAITILGGAALIGLALAAIGLYGVVSYALSQRLREFGIRAALGASYRDLIALVLREALIVASIGSAIGLAAAYSAIGLISSKLVAIPSVNVALVIAGPAIVFLAVALACYLPARRAARVDPLIVLRGL